MINGEFYYRNPLLFIQGNFPFLLFICAWGVIINRPEIAEAFPQVFGNPPKLDFFQIYFTANFMFAFNCLWNNYIPSREKYIPYSMEDFVFVFPAVGSALLRHLPFTAFMIGYGILEDWFWDSKAAVFCRDPQVLLLLFAAVLLMDAVYHAQEEIPRGTQQAYAHVGNSAEEAPRQPLPPSCVEVYRIEPDQGAFNRIVGLDEAKTSITEAFNLILGTEEGLRMNRYGLKPPKGILLYGPPGTGKTSFARASAQKFGLPFVVVNASSVTGKFVGATEQNIRSIFRYARSIAPCVVFWDEIDAVAKMRTGGDINSPSQLALNVMLAELDGFTPNNGVVFIASTNRRDVLDEAILRPGRLDLHIYVGLPDFDSRRKLFMLYLHGRPVNVSEEDINFVAELSNKMSPAEIEQVATQAARKAYYEGMLIERKHLEAAIEEIRSNDTGVPKTGGSEGAPRMPEAERKIREEYRENNLFSEPLPKYRSDAVAKTINRGRGFYTGADVVTRAALYPVLNNFRGGRQIADAAGFVAGKAVQLPVLAVGHLADTVSEARRYDVSFKEAIRANDQRNSSVPKSSFNIGKTLMSEWINPNWTPTASRWHLNRDFDNRVNRGDLVRS